MESDAFFDLFDFCAERKKTQTPPPKTKMSRSELRQAAFAFLHSLHPDGIAENVPTRISRYAATAAGFWCERSRRRLSVVRTALVIMYEDLDDCFTDCTDRASRMKKVAEMQERCRILEAEIRRTEPELAAADDLFSEFRSWDYASSRNPEYRKLRTQIDRECRLLSQGSRLERLREAGSADLCYLAVPRGLINPELLLPAWGVVELFPERPRFKLLRPAENLEGVTPEKRLLLALNVGIAAQGAALFAAGVDANGHLRRPPKRRSRIR